MEAEGEMRTRDLYETLSYRQATNRASMAFGWEKDNSSDTVGFVARCECDRDAYG